ncbi:MULTISPECIES: hypothetical protein [Leuconostoc]|uniref:Enterocin A Immunity n=1 Tax=Leuconostoc suionicum TaxID=1511761 RepID=A0A2N9KG33_9LACO|nr:MULTISPECIES: hypothetical protein [Leuconostoc]API72840.1 hypothetical protein A6B45_09220 [Leuconostoc suionicum]MBE4728291.1 hypothetical protein [Leuconostoc suionicum]MCT4401866.1 hypothetical protein [Leuconostoc suionicum]MDI6522794.1 hypothetical protein [Leuconostoc suionicum]MDI6544923.1 hypothetical protein [Leuconostoc suionicum]
MSKKENLLELLQKLDVNSDEQVYINKAIHQLTDEKQSEQVVARGLAKDFRSLALNQKLSEQGLKLFTELQKPNFAEDVARLSATMWTL